ncbi:MAG TPA: uracil-DNA glycosylase [Actinomycetota bacterium]|nr:uracil-DNA glycosylase [Actinomycetota bacterium]
MTWETLAEVRAEALGCTRCRLSAGRTQVVWMDGNPDSSLMFVGEAPGFHEDRQGLPFVGAAGQLLDSMLATIGLDRTGCCICNVLKCRPPGNRDPMPDEIDACRPYLSAQLGFIKPRVIVTLGNFATRFVLDRQVSISRVRGQRFTIGGATVVPTFHPAAVLHGGGGASPQMTALRDDFALIAAILAEPPPAPPAPPEPPEAPARRADGSEAAELEPYEQDALF